MSKDKERVPSIQEMVAQLADGIKQTQWTNNINTYEPASEKHLLWHQDMSRGRMFIGGNRSGKTVAGAVEAIWWLTRKHPYREIPPWKIEGRNVAVDFVNGVEAITKPEIKKWLPPSELINGNWTDSFDNQSRTLTLANGNYIEFKSYDQDLDKHAGTARDFIWFDEEPPEAIFEENFLRLTSRDGAWWMTMTPVEGATWTLTDLYERSKTHYNSDEEMRDIYVTEVNIRDNKHLNMGVVESIMSELSEEAQLIRGEGKYRHDTGMIFTNFDRDRNVIDKMPFDPRRKPNRIIASVDLGMGAPTAWLWHCVTPTGEVYTFHEMSKADWTIPQFAEYVKKWERENRIVPAFRVGDPAAKQRSNQTGLSAQIAYRQAGLPFTLANNSYDGLDKMNDYLRTGRWKITANCGTLLREMRKYRWEPWATAKMKANNNPKMKPKKKDDHSIDSTRYMFSFLPELSQRPETWEQDKINRINQMARQQMGTVKGMDPNNIIDHELMGWNSKPTEWGYDENVGMF